MRKKIRWAGRELEEDKKSTQRSYKPRRGAGAELGDLHQPSLRRTCWRHMTGVEHAQGERSCKDLCVAPMKSIGGGVGQQEETSVQLSLISFGNRSLPFRRTGKSDGTATACAKAASLDLHWEELLMETRATGQPTTDFGSSVFVTEDSCIFSKTRV